jgi:hypothetical protein
VLHVCACWGRGGRPGIYEFKAAGIMISNCSVNDSCAQCALVVVRKEVVGYSVRDGCAQGSE